MDEKGMKGYPDPYQTPLVLKFESRIPKEDDNSETLNKFQARRPKTQAKQASWLAIELAMETTYLPINFEKMLEEFEDIFSKDIPH
ncbi:hypothetical protein CR513_12330, partial [Mucuna pruriens]